MTDNKQHAIATLRDAAAVIDSVDIDVVDGSMTIKGSVAQDPAMREVARSLICLGALTVSALPKAPDREYIEGTRVAAKDIADKLANSIEAMVRYVATNIQPSGTGGE